MVKGDYGDWFIAKEGNGNKNIIYTLKNIDNVAEFNKILIKMEFYKVKDDSKYKIHINNVSLPIKWEEKDNVGAYGIIKDFIENKKNEEKIENSLSIKLTNIEAELIGLRDYGILIDRKDAMNIKRYIDENFLFFEENKDKYNDSVKKVINALEFYWYGNKKNDDKGRQFSDAYLCKVGKKSCFYVPIKDFNDLCSDIDGIDLSIREIKSILKKEEVTLCNEGRTDYLYRIGKNGNDDTKENDKKLGKPERVMMFIEDKVNEYIEKINETSDIKQETLANESSDSNE